METEISSFFAKVQLCSGLKIYTDFKGFKVSKGFKDFNVPNRGNVVNNHIISI